MAWKVPTILAMIDYARSITLFNLDSDVRTNPTLTYQIAYTRQPLYPYDYRSIVKHKFWRKTSLSESGICTNLIRTFSEAIKISKRSVLRLKGEKNPYSLHLHSTAIRTGTGGDG